MLWEISGLVRRQMGNTGTVVSDIPTPAAFRNFNLMVQINAFNLKEFLLSDKNALMTSVKQIYESNGQDFNVLLAILSQ
jgi:hypothetical protein